MKILFILNEIKQSSFPQDPGRTGETLVSFKGCYFSTFFFKKPRFFKLFLKVEVFFCDVLICEKPLKFLVFMKAEPESGF